MRRLAAALALLVVAACGGGGGGGGSSGGGSSGPAAQPLTAAESARFLTQATFGPTDPEIEALRNRGYDAWITDQINAPFNGNAHQTALETRLTGLQATNASASLNANHFYETWWREAATSQAQLRQRVAFAYSQIFVVSLVDGAISGSSNGIRGAGSYYDMLTRNAFSSYRQLLEEITLHPVMGVYLTYLANQREDANGTRTPDENYAREVMQLMSLGLYELNIDGTVRTDAQNRPLPAYTPADIAGLAKVFTGLSWYHPTPTNQTFFGGNRNADSFVRPMIFYPQYHSISSKAFLGTAIPATTTPDVGGDLRIALDTLANHPNVGPFLAQRLIQQLVTSNPSPAYVRRVAERFNNNGQGVRGDMGAVIRAILTDPEAREMARVNEPTFGKLREPVIRMTNWMRAFGATSVSGNWTVPNTSSNQSLGQSPLASPSVFNFWRPGFTPPGATQLGTRGLLAPEFQIVDEVSVAGYVNTVSGAMNTGFGNGSDVRTTYAEEMAVANDAAALTERMNRLLMYGQMPSGLRQRIQDSVSAIAIPGGTATPAQIDAARLNRVRTAVLMTMSAPEFIAQR